jgi:hypothetical protein
MALLAKAFSARHAFAASLPRPARPHVADLMLKA